MIVEGYSRVQVQLEGGGSVNIWREAAQSLGYLVKRGPYVGRGNISELMNAVARGDVRGHQLELALKDARAVMVSVPDEQMSLPSVDDEQEQES